MSRVWIRSASGGIGLHRTRTTEFLSQAQDETDFNPSTYRAFQRSDMTIHKHTIHHTEANKSHIFTATRHWLFSEHDSTKLGEWLTFLERAVNLTNES